MTAIFAIPAGMVFTFGKMVGDMRQGWAVFAAMAAIFVVMAGIAIASELHGNPLLTALGVDGAAGNMEGKETRFGVVASALFAAITTAASCGAVNAMRDSFLPLGGLVPMWLIQFGEVVFGGVGSGLYGALMYAIVAVFIAGLMSGRTSEYIGKKIETYDMKMVSLAILVTPMLVLIGTAIAVVADAGRAGVANPGAHGFSEILYAFSSAANNNGSAFAGLSANTPFYNVLVEDEPQIRRFVKAALEHEGWQVFEASTVAQGWIECGTRRPDLVVLDLGLPGQDGIALIRDLRAWPEVPLIAVGAIR